MSGMSDLSKVPAFANDDLFHVVIESPRGSSLKLKYDATLGVMSISRPLPLGITFPYDWGFVPSTKAADGDPFDAIIFWDVAGYPGIVVECRALAVVLVEQNGDGPGKRVRNDRVVAMPDAFRRALPNPADALSQRVRDELSSFFLAATALEGKDATILGWEGPDTALRLIREAKV
jgi:inorganic pyrophosphatase